MKKKNMILGCVAAALIASATIAPAMAYFTDHTDAVGNVQIQLGDNTTITEEMPNDFVKQISISNVEGQPVYVRVKIFAPGTQPTVETGDTWVPGADDYYYYTAPVTTVKATDILTLRCEDAFEDASADVKNIIVVYESTPVLYDTAGDPVPYNDSSISWEDNVTVIE